MAAEFQFIQTRDFSWTARPKMEDGTWGEAMHNLEGAWGETLHVYGYAVRTVLEKQWAPNFLSIGLGLGYNEILISASLISDKTFIYSMENQKLLQDRFRSWAKSNSPWGFVYDDIAARANQCSLQRGSALPPSIANLMERKLSSNSLVLGGELSSSTIPDQKFSGILFDAYSAKSSPELWDQEFLEKFLNQTAAPNCVFATYACTGKLKRALTKCGFKLEIRAGFHSKRDSTFAIRQA